MQHLEIRWLVAGWLSVCAFDVELPVLHQTVPALPKQSAYCHSLVGEWSKPSSDSTLLLASRFM